MPVTEATNVTPVDNAATKVTGWYNEANGFFYLPRTDNSTAKNLRVALYDSTGAPLLVADDAAFTPGTGRVVPIGALADETSPDSVDEGDLGVPRMTLARILRVVPSDDTGANLKTASVTGSNAGTGPLPGVVPHLWNSISSTYAVAYAAASRGDADAATTIGAAGAWRFNGTNWDRERTNTTEVALASAARTAAVATGALVNYTGRGVQVDVNVTAKAGATTFTVQLLNPAGQVIAQVAGVALTASQTSSVQFYPGVVAADFTAPGYGRSVAVPRNYKIQITPSDASSVTYSVDAQVIA